MANWTVAIAPDTLKSRLQTGTTLCSSMTLILNIHDKHLLYSVFPAPDGTYPNGVRDVFKQLVS